MSDGSVQQVHDSKLQDFHIKDEIKLRKENDKLDDVNIYFVKNITREDGSILNGYTSFPGYNASINGLSFSYQDNNLEDFITLRDKTFLHELGHYFGLLHTFQDSNTKDISKRELVSSNSYANCGYAGDELCDTPSDPTLSNY